MYMKNMKKYLHIASFLWNKMPDPTNLSQNDNEMKLIEALFYNELEHKGIVIWGGDIKKGSKLLA